MIEIENLTKTFGTQTVISDVSGIFYTRKNIWLCGKKWFWKNSADEDDTWFY